MEKITARVKKDQWRYVNTSCNPANILSRGIQPKDLLQMKTWWKGPPWLQLSLQDWPRRPDINFDRELPDLRKTVLLVLPPEEEFGIKFSSYVRLLRVFAWIRRFCEKARKLNKVPFPDFPKTSQQLMGELPASRVRPARPFSIVGLDFAGPYTLKLGHTRRPVLIKAYACVFVCFTTRACHIELVADRTTAAFVACFRRFVSRRGLPHQVHSDNGANFVGANKSLSQLYTFMRSNSFKECITNWAAPKDICWSFTPSRAPHFGGLWEAAVKSMKVLLRKIVGECKLKFDELTTLLTEAEAIMNSRPLVPIDSLPDDGVSLLTPGHFLTGAPLVALPSLPDETTKLTILRRWNLVQRLTDELWRRWQSEYLVHLQRRSKWKQIQNNIRVGDIVLMKDVDIFQRTWPMGRVTAVYEGSDGLVRVWTSPTGKILTVDLFTSL